MKRKSFWVFVLILCVFLACLCTNYDYDLFARIIVGERFVEGGVLPFKDFLSYTPTHNWYDHEWGSSVIFYIILKYLGAFGLLLFYAVMLFLTTFFVVKTQRLQKHAFPVSIIFTSLFTVLFVRENPSLVRCHLFTFFFFSLFLYILEKNKKSKTKLMWAIPFVTIFWNNVHGGVVSGLGLIFMYMLGEFLNKKPCKDYFISLSVSAPLLIINPYGFNYLNFLFSATTMNRKYITEWWPFFHPRHFWYYIETSLFGIFSYIVMIVNFFRKKRFDYTKFLVVSVTLAEGLWHVKLLTLSLIAVSALCYNEIFSLFIRMKKLLKPVEKSIYYAILVLIFFIPLYSPLVPRADLYKFPLYEIEFLKINDIKGNLLTDFGFGSYAIYKLYPDNLIYMDGRYEEVYNDKEFLALRDYELAEDNWQDVYKNYDTDILMPSKTLAIYEVLKNNPDWVHIFDGRKCGIFVKKENAKKSYIEPEYKINYYRRTMFKSTNFGKKLKRN